MPLDALDQDEATAVLVHDLVASLEDHDPAAAEAADITASSAGVARDGQVFPVWQRGCAVASAHRNRCRPAPDRCVGCALSDAILWCHAAQCEAHVLDFATAVISARREYNKTGTGLLERLSEFERTEGILYTTRNGFFFAGERARLTVPQRVREASTIPLRLVDQVLDILLCDGVASRMPRVSSTKGGAPDHYVIDWVANLLRERTGLGDTAVARLMGLTKDQVKHRRKKQGAGGGT